MSVKDTLDVLPMGIGALDRVGRLYQWTKHLWGCQPLMKLDHVGWFTQGHVPEGYLWSPPPVSMETAMEMFVEASHMRPYILHLIVCPIFMIHLWRKALRKDTILIFTLPIGLYVWPKTFHKPLCITVVLPIISRSNLKVLCFIQGSQLSGACMDCLEGGGSKWQ